MMLSVPVPILLFLGHSFSFACNSRQRLATARRSSLKPGAVTTSERGMRPETGGARPSTAHATVVAFPPATAGFALPVAPPLAEAAVTRQPARAIGSAARSRIRDGTRDMVTPVARDKVTPEVAVAHPRRARRAV